MPEEPVTIPLPTDRQGLVIAHGKGKPPASEALHVHAGTELNLVVTGRARRLVGDVVLDLAPGHLLCLPPGTRHAMLDGSASFRSWVLWFRQPWQPPVDTVPLRKLRPKDRRELEQLCRIIHRHADEAATADALIPGLRALTERAWRRASEPSRPRRISAAVATAIDLFHQRAGAVNLDVVAARAGLSRSRLSHRFSAEVGLTMAAYRNRCRLERFDTLRRERPGAPLADLALASGFSTYMQFYRAHRQQRGTAPSG